MANHTNLNIQHTQSLKYKQLPIANRACNVCRGWQQLLRVLKVWMVKYLLDKLLENTLQFKIKLYRSEWYSCYYDFSSFVDFDVSRKFNIKNASDGFRCRFNEPCLNTYISLTLQVYMFFVCLFIWCRIPW